VITDPTGNFLLAPDLGADVIRVFSINRSTGLLTECPSIAAAPGDGPRHAAFWTQNGNRLLFVANELANTVSSYTTTYTSGGCPTFARKQTLGTFPNNGTGPEKSKNSEIRVKGNSVYVTNRWDETFNGNDSIAQFSLSYSGRLTFVGLTNSYGIFPRTFEISNAGDYAVIGNQYTANVVVVRRNPYTGALGAKVAEARVGPTGEADVWPTGMTSITLAE
jgi:6-phosphogluconolactonase (cycloisomerase 2 family)